MCRPTQGHLLIFLFYLPLERNTKKLRFDKQWECLYIRTGNLGGFDGEDAQSGLSHDRAS
jgi:hypothetical protein